MVQGQRPCTASADAKKHVPFAESPIPPKQLTQPQRSTQYRHHIFCKKRPSTRIVKKKSTKSHEKGTKSP